MTAPAPAREPVGVLGGTFDPVHLGHLALAGAVRRVMGFARVLLVPAGVPPHKRDQELTAAVHREAMLRLAVAGHPWLEVSTIELERPGVGYTIETLRALREAPPPIEPVFCLGLDALAQIHTWRSWETLLAEFDLAVVDRSNGAAVEAGGLPDAVRARLVTVPARPHAGRALVAQGPRGRIFRIAMRPLAVSSSDVRARAASDAPLDDLVPPAVARYIQSIRLYR